MDWNGRSKKYNPRWKSATACREGDPVNSENTLPDEEEGGANSRLIVSSYASGA